MADRTPLPVLRMAVVGHTNTGKTSLMRTLTRDVSFGEVSDRPAVTRHVEGAVLIVDDQPAIELYDTPGLEDSIGLLEHLDALQTDRRQTGLESIERFFASPEAHQRFAQEAKALRQLLGCDVALYVIDVRDRVLGKHRDELEILARCARPVVPVLNFSASVEARTAEWRTHLSRVNLHAVAEFDTVVLDESSERRLFEKIRSLLDSHAPTIDAYLADRARQLEHMHHASARAVADLLIDAAAFAVRAPMDDPARLETVAEQFKQAVREREQACVNELLRLYRFRLADYDASDTPLVGQQWGTDLFSPEALKQFGLYTGSAAAAGALAGLSIDALLGGATLGGGAAVGAAIGAVLELGRSHGRRLLDRARGMTDLRVDDRTLQLLAARQLRLVQTLLHRGHASFQPIRLADGDVTAEHQPEPTRAGGPLPSAPRTARVPHAPTAAVQPDLPRLNRTEPIGRARLRPHWSRLPATTDAAPRIRPADGSRDAAVRDLTLMLRPAVAPTRHGER